MIMKFPDGMIALVHVTALHRRKPRRKSPYARPTDWHAEARGVIRCGRTQRDAIANLRAAISGVPK